MGEEHIANRYATTWCSQSPESVAAFFVEDGSLRVNDAPRQSASAMAKGARGFMMEKRSLGVHGYVLCS